MHVMYPDHFLFLNVKALKVTLITMSQSIPMILYLFVCCVIYGHVLHPQVICHCQGLMLELKKMGK